MISFSLTLMYESLPAVNKLCPLLVQAIEFIALDREEDVGGAIIVEI